MTHKIADVNVFYVSTSDCAGVGDSTLRYDKACMAVVEIRTDSGLSGYGITIKDEIAGLIRNTIKPILMGKDPVNTEDIWQEMFLNIRGSGRKGLSLVAISVVDIALWDLKGKILGLPVHRLLGGGKRFIPTYASGGWTSYTLDELLAEMKSFVDLGYSTIKMKVGVELGRNIKEDSRRVHAVRDMVGPDIDIIIDANNVWDSGTAVRFAEMVRDCDIAAFEEPVCADDIPGLGRIRSSINIPVATGEHEYTKYGMRDLLAGKAVDIVQIDATKAGGITEMVKVSAMCQAWNLLFAPHCFEIVHMHLLSAAPNAFKLEKLFLFNGIMRRCIKNYPEPVNGILEIPDLPGMGLEFDMEWIMQNNELK